MKKSRQFAVAVATVLGMISGSAQAQTGADDGPSRSVPFGQLRFAKTGLPDIENVAISPAYGDLKTRDHGTFVRWPAGYASSLHTHQHEYMAIVVRGVVANYHPGEKMIPLVPGSYWFQRGQEVHTTKCLSKTDCTFFLYMKGPFDHTVAVK